HHAATGALALASRGTSLRSASLRTSVMRARTKAAKAISTSPHCDIKEHSCRDEIGHFATASKRDVERCATASSSLEQHGIGSSPAQPCEAMHRPRGRSLFLVRLVHGYYGTVRLLLHVHVRRSV